MTRYRKAWRAGALLALAVLLAAGIPIVIITAAGAPW